MKTKKKMEIGFLLAIHMPHAIIIVEFWFFFHIWIFIFIYLASSLLFLFSLALFVCLLVCVCDDMQFCLIFFYYFLLFSFNSIPNDMKTVDNNHRIHTQTQYDCTFFFLTNNSKQVLMVDIYGNIHIKCCYYYIQKKISPPPPPPSSSS